MTHNDELKRQAAEKAVEQIESGMIVGLGSGSTAVWALRRIAELLQTGELRDIRGIPCSSWISEEACERDIPLTTLEDVRTIHITIDGADEVDPDLNVIKGGGGALLREKIVAQSSQRQIIVVDESKLVDQLGTSWGVPVAVTPFGWGAQKRFIESLGAAVTQRLKPDGKPFITDDGNQILDCQFGKIDDPRQLAQTLIQRVGIVEHGLFIDVASEVIVAGANGIRHLKR